MQYRLKTEEEFINEFGPNFRRIVVSCWPERMDQYFGLPMPSDYVPDSPSSFSSRNFGGNHTYSKDMITNAPLEVEDPNSDYKIVSNGLFKV